MKLVLASGNKGKVKELRQILQDVSVEILSLQDFPEIGDIIENGKTFEENAIIKAQAVSKATGVTAVADDSGLEVDYLEGAPGVFSARFAGEQKDDQQNNEKLLRLLEGVPQEERTARFKCAIAICCPDGKVYTEEGTCEGVIGNEPKGMGGFGYDPLFIVPSYGQTFAELKGEVKNQISHRARAMAKIRPILTELIAKEA